jgi:regulator of sigma E protease
LSYDNNEINTYSELRKSIVSASIYEVERDGEILEISLPTDFLGRLSSSDNPSLFEFRTPFIIQSVSEESLNKDYDIRQGDMIVSYK